MLDCYSATESTDTLKISLADRFGMIDEPAQPIDRDIPVDPFEDVEKSVNAFIEGGMDAPGPAGLGEFADHGFQFRFHDRLEVRPWLEKVLEIRRTPDEIFPGTGQPEPGVAFTGMRHREPFFIVAAFLARFLGKEAVGDSQGELSVFGQMIDHRVVLRIVLAPAAGIRNAGDAEAVQLPHEVPGRVHLVGKREFLRPGDGRIQDERIGLGDEKTGRLARCIPGDQSSRRVGTVAVDAQGAQSGLVQQGAVIEVQHENRGIRCGFVDFIEAG